MTDVMIDIHFAEALIARQPKDLRDSFSRVYYEQIYTLHNVNKDSVELFFKMIQENPKAGDIFYENLLEAIKKKGTEIQEKK